MRMSHVKYFLALSLDRNFTLAAKHCGISQPSLTNAIRHFEQELGGELFHRGTTETTLSELGLAVRPHFEQLVQCEEDARRAATLFKSLPTDLITPTNGALNAQAHAFHRRRRSRRPRHNDFDQNADLRHITIDAAADNLGRGVAPINRPEGDSGSGGERTVLRP